jgi:Protein of unknown function (DUF4231)
VLAILIPVLAEYGHIPGFDSSQAFLVGAAAGLIVLLEGLQVLNKWQENWILYRAACEGLRNEQHLFAAKAGRYAGLKPDAAQRLLAERISGLVMAEHGKGPRRMSTRLKPPALFEPQRNEYGSTSTTRRTSPLCLGTAASQRRR